MPRIYFAEGTLGVVKLATGELPKGGGVMRLDPEIPEGEYRQALLAEVTATFGEERARLDVQQVEAAAHALSLIARVEVPWMAEDPHFLGIRGDE